MLSTGLKNRFSEETKAEWIFWHECLVCGKNKWDALHHIISPSIEGYKNGTHNESVLNSCPIHNFGCHIDNEPFLTKSVGLLLLKVYTALDEIGYVFNENDRQFLEIYGEFYD